MRLYVACPAGYVTGGPEALHQLVHAATRLGYDAAVSYFPADHPAPKAAVYDCYDTPIALDVVDAPDSFVVVPETEVPRLADLRHAQRGLWWLSVDNFASRNELARKHLGPIAGGAGGGRSGPLDVVYDARFGCVHLAQSEYARAHLRSHGATALMLTDYIRREIVEESLALLAHPRDDIVAYNASKGLEFTQRLIEASPPSIAWVPIENLTPREVAGLLGRAKAYVDFGNHPGRDRIPREAVLCGACVITGSRGSAANGVDVPVPAAYRFADDAPDAVPRVLSLIENVMKDYPAHAVRFDPYRDWVRGQERVFTSEVFTALSTIEGHQRRVQQFAV